MISNKTIKYLVVISILLMGLVSFSQTQKVSQADELSAKAFLEDLMIRRYTQGLSTVVNKQAFVVGVQLDLMDTPKVAPKPNEKPPDQIETPTDLLVGTLDPEKLMQQYGMNEEKPLLVGYLASKRIKAVFVSIGLQETIGEEAKKDVSKWLSDRLAAEFGNAGKGNVTFVKDLPKIEKTDTPAKAWWDWLNEFQHLAGQLLMVVAALSGIMFWRLTTAKATVNSNKMGDASSINLSTENKTPKDPALTDGAADIKKTLDQTRDLEELLSITVKINSLVPRLTKDLESVVRSWCQSGDEGKLKLVCFAEAVGRDLGRLPIPVDSVKEMAKIFSKMAEVQTKEKLQILEKAYWDLVSVLNLGSAVLVQPFSYLSGVDVNLINSMLINQNPRMKTLVSLFLPGEVRQKFIKPMTSDQKLELLNIAAQLNEIPSDDLFNFDKDLMGKMKSGSSADSIPLEMSLEKVISSLSIVEEIDLLTKIQHSSLIEYKRKRVSLAFFKDWPDDKLSVALSRLAADKVVTYLRYVPEMKEKLIALSPPMAAEVIGDEYNQPDKMSVQDKIQNLENIVSILNEMVVNKEIDLSEVFSINSSSTVGDSDNVVPIRSA